MWGESLILVISNIDILFATGALGQRKAEPCALFLPPVLTDIYGFYACRIHLNITADGSASAFALSGAFWKTLTKKKKKSQQKHACHVR